VGDWTAIEWSDATWNPVTGCSKVSPGCAHCYAETLAKRLHRMGQQGYTDLPWTPENAEANVFLHPDRLDVPLRWRKPRMVFVNSMSDLFHELVPDDFLDRAFAVMGLAVQHTFQILTKRPDRMAGYLSDDDVYDRVQREVDRLPAALLSPSAEDRRRRRSSAWTSYFPWPLPNVWSGVSIENRRYVHRAGLLRETPAAVRFISAEPLLGPLVLPGEPTHGFDIQWPDGRWGPELDLRGIDWLIVGGESGPRHRPVDPQWVRDLRDACAQAGVSFFVKQMGGARPGDKLENLPQDLRIREMPRAAATG
jgi:protein gp37